MKTLYRMVYTDGCPDYSGCGGYSQPIWYLQYWRGWKYFGYWADVKDGSWWIIGETNCKEFVKAWPDIANYWTFLKLRNKRNKPETVIYFD